MTDYFQLFGIARTFSPNVAALRRKYFSLSRTFHPDKFATASAEEQKEALIKSSELNEAWETLSNPLKTMQYLLSLEGVLEKDEKYKLAPAFLMEMMELNEAMEEDNNSDAAIMQLASANDAWEAEVKPLVEAYIEDNDNSALLPKIKDAYFRKKYLLRLSDTHQND